MGIFDYDDPQNSGRLAFAAGLLDAAGPQARPVSLGQALSAGLLGGQRASQVAGESNRRNQLVDLQMQRIRQQQEEEQRARMMHEQQAAFLGQLPAQLNMPGGQGPTVAAAQNQGKLTPQMVATAMQLGIDPKRLEMVVNAPNLGQPEVKHWEKTPGANGPEVTGFTAYGKPVNTGARAWIDDLDPTIQAAKDRRASLGAPKTNVVVNAEKPLVNELAGGVGKALETSRANAQGAASTISTAQRVRRAVDQGIIAGPTASARVSLSQIGQVLGVNGKDDAEKLLNTRQAIQGLAQLELDAAQQMKGQGQITEAERAIIRRAASGDIDSMTAPELVLLTQTLEKTARAKIASHSSQVDKLSKMPSAAPLLDLMRVDMPGEYGANAWSIERVK
jgi:hypothetical protein